MNRFSIVVGLALAVLPPSVMAQATFEEPGFWFMAGGGAGITETDCVRCSTARNIAPIFVGAAGGSASEHLKFGLEALFWYQASDTARQYVSGIVFAQYFPIRELPFHVQFGIGGGAYKEDQGTDFIEASGFALHGGAGYDIFFSTNWSVRPFVRYLFSNGLTQRTAVGPQLLELNYSLWYFGAGITWQKF